MSDGLDWYLRMKDEISGPVGKAEASLARLEQQLQREDAALGKLETKLAEASDKLARLQAPSPKGMEAFEKQAASVRALDQEVEKAAASLRRLTEGAGGEVDIKAVRKAQTDLTKLQAKADAARAKLDEIGKRAGPDPAAIAKQQKVVSGIQDEIAKRKASIGVLNQKIPAVQRLAGEEKAGLSEMAQGLQSAGGPLGSFVGKLQQLGKLGTAGIIAAIVVAIIALATAGIIAAVALARFALSAADAARSARLLNEASAGSVAAGTELTAVIAQLSRHIPLASSKIAEMARELEDAKLEGREMQLALTAMGIVASAKGDAAAGKIKAIAEQSKQARRFLLGARDIYGEFASLSGTGIKAADIYAALAKSMNVSIGQAKALLLSGRVAVKDGLAALEIAAKAKFGGIVERQMLGFSVQVAKAKENLDALFADVNIEAFLGGVRDILSILDQSTVTGKALKVVLTEALSGFFDIASKVFPYVRAFILGIVIAALIFYIQFRKVGRAIAEAFGGAASVDKLRVAMYLGVAVVGLMVGLFAALALVILAAITPMLIFTGLILGPFIVMGVIIYLVIQLFKALGKSIGGAFDSLKGVSLYDIGANIIQGLIGGITSKIAAVTGAISGIAGKIKDGFTGALGIASPSKVFAEYGKNTVEGYEQGVERQAPKAQEKTISLGKGKPASGGGNGGAKSGHTINIYVTDTGLAAKVREIVANVLEQEDGAEITYAEGVTA